jgi:hypothetical protein
MFQNSSSSGSNVITAGLHTSCRHASRVAHMLEVTPLHAYRRMKHWLLLWEIRSRSPVCKIRNNIACKYFNGSVVCLVHIAVVCVPQFRCRFYVFILLAIVFLQKRFNACLFTGIYFHYLKISILEILNNFFRLF